jgi:multidrug efflux system membrane fusion protein
LRIRVDNPARHLLPGMFVRAQVPRGGPVEGIAVPQQAVVRAGDGQPRVWTLDAEGKARQHIVRVGKVKAGEYPVESGLTAGATLVVEGQDRLRAGEPARAQAWVDGAARPATAAR